MVNYFKTVLIIYSVIHLGLFQTNKSLTYMYTKIKSGSNTNDISSLIKSFSTSNFLACLNQCNKNIDCSFINYANNICKHYTPSIINSFTVSSPGTFYEKDRKNPNFVKTIGLINYWSFYGNGKDSVGTADLLEGVRATWTTDRDNKLSSSLGLSSGYYTAPAGNYFNDNLSILAWVKIKAYGSNARLIDFSPTGSSRCDVSFVLSDGSSGAFKLMIRDTNSNYQPTSTSTRSLIIDKWEHVACTLSGTSIKLYLNGIFDESYSSKPVCNTLYQSNFIGGTNFASDLLNADIDELKIFNRTLTQAEIRFEMNNNYYI